MKPNESFIAQPVRSLQTMLRVISKDDPRLPSIIPDGIYGPDTMNTVAAFQRLYGIPVTGITDQNTWDQVVLIYESALIRIGKAEPIEVLLDPGQVITFGESNPYIYLAQGMLAQLSTEYTKIPQPAATGILEDDTAESIRAFQGLVGLPITGNLDRITWFNLSKHFTLNAHKNLNHGQL